MGAFVNVVPRSCGMHRWPRSAALGSECGTRFPPCVHACLHRSPTHALMHSRAHARSRAAGVCQTNKPPASKDHTWPCFQINGVPVFIRQKHTHTCAHRSTLPGSCLPSLQSNIRSAALLHAPAASETTTSQGKRGRLGYPEHAQAHELPTEGKRAPAKAQRRTHLPEPRPPPWPPWACCARTARAAPAPAHAAAPPGRRPCRPLWRQCTRAWCWRSA